MYWRRWCVLNYRSSADSAKALLHVTAASIARLVSMQEEMHRLRDVEAVQRVVVAVGGQIASLQLV